MRTLGQPLHPPHKKLSDMDTQQSLEDRLTLCVAEPQVLTGPKAGLGRGCETATTTMPTTTADAPSIYPFGLAYEAPRMNAHGCAWWPGHIFFTMVWQNNWRRHFG